MSAPIRNDAAFRWTESGQTYLHHLGSKLHRPVADVAQVVHTWRSPDLTTERRIAIGSGVQDLRAQIQYDGMTESLRRFMAAARRGANLEYFPSMANPSESYACTLLSDSGIELDADFWWDRRNAVEVLRRIDGGSWQGAVSGSLFYYKAGNLVPGLSFTRSGAVGPYVDEDGVLQSAAANIFRTDWIDTDADDVHDTPTLLLEPALTNLNDEDDLTAWTETGASVAAGSIDDPAGGTGAYRLTDNAGGVLEFVSRPITYTGDAVKSATFVIREATMASSGNQALLVRDTTAGANRLLLQITAWSGGEPTITAGTGTLLGKRYIGNGYWAVYGQTTSVTAANTNQLRVYAAETTSATGVIDVYRINTFDSTIPSFSVLDESEARSADTLDSAITFAPQAMTIYLAFYDRGYSRAQSDFAGDILTVGRQGSGNGFVQFDNTSGDYRVTTVGADGTGASRTFVTSASWGDYVELVAKVDASFGVAGEWALNGGAGTEKTLTANADGMPESWAADYVRMHMESIVSVKVLAGSHSLADMRAA